MGIDNQGPVSPAEPMLVHMSWAPALRGAGLFLIMFLLGFIPAVFLTPGLISAFWLSLVGDKAMGKIVATRDISASIDDVNRTGKQSTIIATIEYLDAGNQHRFEWNGWMRARGLGGKRLPVVGDSLSVRFIDGKPSLTRVDRFADVWLPHGLLWPASMVFVLAGVALSLGQIRARRRGIELAFRNRHIDVDSVLVEDDDSYTDGCHFRYTAEFEVDGCKFISRSPTQKGRLDPVSAGQILYLPEDPSVNWLVVGA